MKISKVSIPLLVVIFASILIMFFNVVNSNNEISSDETLDNADTTNSNNVNVSSCSEKGYFIQKIQGEIYSYYGNYESVIIENCSTLQMYDDTIRASCEFKFRATKTQNYQESSMFRTYSCK